MKYEYRCDVREQDLNAQIQELFDNWIRMGGATRCNTRMNSLFSYSILL